VVCPLHLTVTMLGASVPQASIVIPAGNEKDCLYKMIEGCFPPYLFVRVMNSLVRKRLSPKLVQWFLDAW